MWESRSVHDPAHRMADLAFRCPAPSPSPSGTVKEASMDTRERERTDLVGSDLASALSSASDHARSNGAAICAQASSFPVDAEATIYRPAKSAMTSGRAGTRHWVLEFEPHSPLFIEPLM